VLPVGSRSPGTQLGDLSCQFSVLATEMLDFCILVRCPTLHPSVSLSDQFLGQVRSSNRGAGRGSNTLSPGLEPPRTVCKPHPEPKGSPRFGRWDLNADAVSQVSPAQSYVAFANARCFQHCAFPMLSDAFPNCQAFGLRASFQNSQLSQQASSDRMTERRKWSTPVRPLTVARAREIPASSDQAGRAASLQVRSAYDDLIAQYLDTHDAFERVSDRPAWVLKVKRHPAVGG
jgi:hypothetical protein